MVSLWIYAYSRGVGSAREIARRCAYDPALEWLCGMEAINYHTLSDFRGAHGAALQELFVEVLGVSSAQGLVSLERVMHDGTKIKACASSDSFRRQERLRAHLEAARQQVQALSQDGSDYGELVGGVQRVEQNLQAKPEQVVADGGFTSRENILAMAAQGIDFIGSIGEQQAKGASVLQRNGVAPEFSAQAFSYDEAEDLDRCPAGQTLRGVAQGESRPGVVQCQYRAEAAACQACPFKAKCCPKADKQGRTVTRSVEVPEVRQFRQKMQTPQAQEVYRPRAPVAELPNAWIKEKLGLRQFRLRGLVKVGLEALWACLTYNIAQWIRLCWRPSLAGAQN